MRAFITGEHESGRQVFRGTFAEWIVKHCGHEKQMSNRSVGRLLYRLGYRRRRGRIKTFPLDGKRLARIRRFLVEMDRAVKEEDKHEAIIAYMDESFVHQAHGSVYSYFFTDENGAVDDGFGRTIGKGLRMIMVHAITKHGPLDTAEFLWQAKLSKGDYHASMTDVMFMEWLGRRLAPAFEKLFGDKKMILVLDNASYHHGFGEEVRVPETNSKKYTFGAKSITARRKKTAPNVGVPEFHFEVPQEAGSTFPGVRSVGGVSKEEVAIATREYLQLHHPTKLVERVEAFMQGKGWQLVWTPPYMPTFQPIELFWQHGKAYVSFN
ncbi:unnamed protein product, partial [Ascophyllum nodosum]